MQSGIKEKDEKDKKKQDVKYPDYWDGNIYICGSIFIYGSGNFYCSLPWNLREKGEIGQKISNCKCRKNSKNQTAKQQKEGEVDGHFRQEKFET